MRKLSLLGISFAIFSLLLAANQPAAADPGGPPSSAAALAGTGFTYQGQLQSGGAPVSGSCDLAFRLYDADSAGAQVGSAITTTVTVNAGLFTAPLDFGAGAFTGAARWLDIRVRCPAGGGSFTPLSQRQPLTAAPYALFATTVPYSGLAGVPVPLHDLASPAACSNAQVATWTGATWTCATVSGVSLVYAAGAGLVLSGTTFALDPAYTDGRYWQVTGNAGTSPANFLGTTDNMTLTLAVNGAAALRLVPTGGASPNVIGGSASNSVGAGVVGATIGGGNAIINNGNRVTANYGTVSGGCANTASGPGATVGGGGWDGGSLGSNVAAGAASTIGGGMGNVISAPGWYATLGGGLTNTASLAYATVGGGVLNTASGWVSTVPGGQANIAAGSYSFAAGTQARALYNGDFVWSDTSANPISSTVADQFLVRASGGISLTTNAAGNVGCSLPAGSGSWNCASDRNLKANFSVVNGLQVLDALAGLPLQTWNYKTQDASIRHLGPMAQDFHAAFGVGENDTTISTVDAQGVALAAIQGLYAVVKDKDAQIAAQQAEINHLQAGQADVNTRLAALESSHGPAPLPLALPWLLLAGLALLNLGGLAGYGLARHAILTRSQR